MQTTTTNHPSADTSEQHDADTWEYRNQGRITRPTAESAGYVDPFEVALKAANDLVDHYEEQILNRVPQMSQRLKEFNDNLRASAKQYANLRIVLKKNGFIEWGMFKPFVSEKHRKTPGVKVNPRIDHLPKVDKRGYQYRPETLKHRTLTPAHWELVCELENEAARLRKTRAIAVKARTYLNELQKELLNPTPFDLNARYEKLVESRRKRKKSQEQTDEDQLEG